MNIELVLTRNCNLNCKYCFEGNKFNENMTSDMIPQINLFIQQYIKNTFVVNKESINIDFNGGEALLNKDFIINFIKESVSFNYSYSITTNGVLLDDNFLEFISTNNIILQISIDGKKDTNDLNRLFYDGKGSFDLVYNNLIKIHEKYKKIILSLNMVYTPRTINFLSDNISFLLDNDFTNLSFCACADFNWSQTSIQQLKKQIRKIGKMYIRSFKDKKEIYLAQISDEIKNCFNGFSKTTCGACIDHLAILPSGNILPCGGFVGCKQEKDIIIGNIYSDINLKRISYYQCNEDLVQYNNECKECALAPRCHNNCFANNLRINGNRKKIVDSNCLINQIIIIETDRLLAKLLKSKNQYFITKYETYL